MRVVAAIPAVAILAGSAIGILFPDLPVRASLLLLIVVWFGALHAWRRSHAVGVGVAVAVGFAVGGAMLAARTWQTRWRPTLRIAFEQMARRQREDAEREGRRLPQDDEAFAIVEGVLRGDAAARADGVSLAVDVDGVLARGLAAPSAGLAARRTDAGLPRQAPASWVRAAGGVQVSVSGSLAAQRAGEWRGGRRVRLPIQLHRAARYLDREVPDAERALARRGTTLVGTVKSGALVEVVARGSRVDEAFAAVRGYARRAIARAVGTWSPRSAGIVAAIVIGDRVGLDAEVQRKLQEAGTYHVIAISGGNIAILAGLLLVAFRVIGLLGRAAMIGAMVVLLAYEQLVGGGASVDRATLMALIYFGARLVDERSSPLNTLSVVAACVIVAEPLSIVEPAFVLTFGATLALLAVAPAVRAWRLPRRVHLVAGMLAASAATETVLLPVGALVFSRVTLAGLVLNFAAIPLMAVAQIGGMTLVPVSLVSSRAAAAIGYVAHVAASGLIWSADFVRFAPAAIFRVAPPAAWVVGIYYLALAAAVFAGRRRRLRRAASAVVCGAALWIVAEPWATLASRGDGRLHATFIDVGQGDAALIRFPRGASMLVDAGGLGGSSAFDVGDRVVAPVLRASGVRRLAVLVLTHGDPDHIGGAAAVIREFRPQEVWEGIPVPPFVPLQALRHATASVQGAWVTVKTGDRRTIDAVEVTVRHPGAPDWERQRVRNDDSIVLELRWREVSILLTGDIGKAVERELTRSIAPAPIRIVKVPHHGSLTSSLPEFVAALAPRVAIVSVGRTNHFGHPVPEVLDRYRESGAGVFRTDQDGEVEVDTDGHDLKVGSFIGRTYEAYRSRP